MANRAFFMDFVNFGRMIVKKVLEESCIHSECEFEEKIFRWE